MPVNGSARQMASIASRRRKEPAKPGQEVGLWEVPPLIEEILAE